MNNIKTEATYYGLGRRKEAIARVWLVENDLSRIVNDTKYEEYFTTFQQRASGIQGLKLTSHDDKFGLKVKVIGGGKEAQAEAVRLGVARALIKFNPAWRKQLKGALLLTRDPRVKERKKFGLKRARRAPQFSKR
jgi:small subunit ribosomal protein S9